MDPRVALEAGARGFVANSLQGYGARHVGESYLQHEIDPLTRNLLHGAMGAGAGAIINGDDPTRGALSGAMSMFAEMGADWMNMRTPKRSIHTDADLKAYMDDLQYQADMGRLIGATAAYALGQDVGIAAITGGTAVEFNHVGSHAAAASAELAAHQRGQSAQQGGGPDDALDEEIVRITGLDSALEFLSKAKDALFRPPSPPLPWEFRDSETDIQVTQEFLDGVSSSHAIQHAAPILAVGAYGAAEVLAHRPEISEWAAGVYEDAKREYPALVWAERVASRLPSDIEYGLQFLRDERERSYRRVNEFVRDPSWERFSLGDTIKVLGYTGYDVAMELSRPQLEGLAFAATTMEYVKAYGRRTLRYMGVSPLVAQGVMDAAEVGTLVWGGAGLVRGGAREVGAILAGIRARQSARPALEVFAVLDGRIPASSVFHEVGAFGRTQEMRIWDSRWSAATSENITITQQSYRPLLEGEGRVGTFEELSLLSKKGDNLARHHIPNDQYMCTKSVSRDQGISMMVEDPVPGAAGRHREIHKMLRKLNLSLSPRDALAQSIWRARQVYMQDMVYFSDIRRALQEVIYKNKKLPGDLFSK